ncbi:hypothetical protein [Pseudarthrobacter sp. efr-133-R2A-89]|uniref:hypothetical protein n=1 Tax=Pseudarthrobacter sp. efr-133-R2A-89 TaxID=3040302 RepID=UPI002552DB5F|nr:hypothetical protein [Pseudarthrobacter sp. efr-133-R2A-89]
MEYTEAEKQRVRYFYSDRLAVMLGEAGRCGAKDLEAIRDRVMIQQDWALSNHLTAEAASFADLQYWIQAETLKTTADMGILTFAVEHQETEVHQQAIAKNPHATPEILEQIIRKGNCKNFGGRGFQPQHH